MKRFLLLTIFSFWPLTSQAYNFLYIHPTTGRPIGWAPGTTIHYYVDPGPLGRLTNEQARILLAEAMKIWENASPNANVPHFEYAGLLPEDVTKDNYQKYVSLFTCYSDDLTSCRSDAQKDLKTVIVFDDDSTRDSILEKELCRIGGCSASSGARVFSGTSSNPGNIVQGIAVFGSSLGLSSALINQDVMGIFIHELGHLLGLAHTSVNEDAYINDRSGFGKYMPTMFFATTHSNLNTAKSAATLNPDDIAGITTLYPSSTAAANTGTIKGTITKSDGTPMMHVNVIARNIEDPLCESYSFLSGKMCHPDDVVGNCLVDEMSTERSRYSITVPPGTYSIEVEELADSHLRQSFSPFILPDENIAGNAEFWNDGDIADESNTLKSEIYLSAGQTRDNINIVLNRNTAPDDRIKYIPLSSFSAGPGTLCPSQSSTDYAALIGISESSGDTTGEDDGTSHDSGNSQSSTMTGGCSLIY